MKGGNFVHRIVLGGLGGRVGLHNVLLLGRGSLPLRRGRTHLSTSVRSRMAPSSGSLGSRDGTLPPH
jgi:hypothetical protein